jgi:dethiobiotin synthetase
MPNGLFVLGTDTGVGKTLVACALIRLFRQRGLDAVGFKPIATGAESGRWLDAEALCDASYRVEPPEKVCPLRYAAALAPVPAARLEGAAPDLDAAREAMRELAGRHELLVAEGVGGLLVPMDSRTLLVDFVRETRLPAVLVARAALGTINHTLLSLRELDRAGVPVAALILNVTRAEDAANVSPSRQEIERHAGRTISAVIPHLELKADAGAAPGCLVPLAVQHLAAQLDAPRLLG